MKIGQYLGDFIYGKIVASISSSKMKGKIGEKTALILLFCKGYRLIQRNLRRNTGEIDLLMSHKGILVAVEVKLRTNQQNIKRTISRKQYQRISNSLQKEYSKYYSKRLTGMRIDGVFISLQPFSIEIITLSNDYFFQDNQNRF